GGGGEELVALDLDRAARLDGAGAWRVLLGLGPLSHASPSSRPRRRAARPRCAGRSRSGTRCPPWRERCRRARGRGGPRAGARRDRTPPAGQTPHCMAPASMNACCTGWSWPSFSSPSTVVIGLPATAWSLVRQERVGCPSTSTVQAPHWPSPQ